MKFFDCLRQIQAELYPAQEGDLFVGIGTEEEQRGIASCCKKLLENVFKLGQDSPAVQSLTFQCIDKLRESRRMQPVLFNDTLVCPHSCPRFKPRPDNRDTQQRKARMTTMTLKRPYDALKVHGMVGVEAVQSKAGQDDVPK